MGPQRERLTKRAANDAFLAFSGRETLGGSTNLPRALVNSAVNKAVKRDMQVKALVSS